MVMRAEHNIIYLMFYCICITIAQVSSKLSVMGVRADVVRKRKSRIRGHQKAARHQLSSLSTFLFSITLLYLHPSVTGADAAGLSIGSVTSTDSCYSAFQSNKRLDENVVDREGYVSFINDLSDDAFISFQYNEELDQWGYFLTSEFEHLPANIQGEFYKHACGGPLIICDNAFLYTYGTGSGEVPSPQQEVYLYQVCIGVEEAIEYAIPTQPAQVQDPPAGVISGEVYLDSNNNGLYDASDSGIEDVMVSLFSCSGEPISTDKTSSYGLFRFEVLTPGDYFVIIHLPSGYVEATVSDGNIHIIDEQGSEKISRTICYKIGEIQEGGQSHVELSFGMEFAPTGSPTPQQTFNSSAVSDVPSGKPSMRPSHSFWPTHIPTGLSMLPSYMPSEEPSSSVPSISPSASPSNSHHPSVEPSNHPTRYGEAVGPIQTDGLRITLFGIDKVQNEAGWSVGHALYINDFFNSEWNYAFDVDVEVILTDQTENLDSFGEENSASTRSLEEQTSVEIEYTQISNYRTIDPLFADITYILQEPFATTLSRYDYISFLQLQSPNYANVSSVSPVILPPSSQHDASSQDGESRSGVQWWIFLLIAVLVLLLVAVFYQRRRRRESEKERRLERANHIKEHLGSMKKNGTTKDSGASELDGATLSRPEQSQDRDSVTYSSATHSLTRSHVSSGSQVYFTVVIPPGKVGCIIDTSPEGGPYISQLHKFSPLRDDIQVGDRILAVDDEDVRGMNASDVSKLLGSRSENEERRITVSREIFYDQSVDACVDESKREESQYGCADDEESKRTATSHDPPGSYEHESSLRNA